MEMASTVFWICVALLSAPVAVFLGICAIILIVRFIAAIIGAIIDGITGD